MVSSVNRVNLILGYVTCFAQVKHITQDWGPEIMGYVTCFTQVKHITQDRGKTHFGPDFFCEVGPK